MTTHLELVNDNVSSRRKKKVAKKVERLSHQSSRRAASCRSLADGMRIAATTVLNDTRDPTLTQGAAACLLDAETPGLADGSRPSLGSLHLSKTFLSGDLIALPPLGARSGDRCCWCSSSACCCCPYRSAGGVLSPIARLLQRGLDSSFVSANCGTEFWRCFGRKEAEKSRIDGLLEVRKQRQR